jgi:hypothetical protein
MNVFIQIDTTGYARYLTDTERQQLPFAISLTVNRVGLAFQQAQRARQAQVFTLRRADFLAREGVKRLSPAASKRVPSVTFGVSPRADFLYKFETGDEKRPRSGSALSIPLAVRPTPKAIVRKRDRLAAFQFQQRPRSPGARFDTYVGRRRTLMLRRPDGSGVVLQRTGTGSSGSFEGTRVLYTLQPSVPTPDVLEFALTADRIAREQWQPIFSQALAQALASRR